MQNEIYVPYTFKVLPGKTIEKKQFKEGKKLYKDLTKFCKTNLTGSYEIDKKQYAQGIRVQFQYKKDVTKVHEWLDN
jgi:hypothetical protein